MQVKSCSWGPVGPKVTPLFFLLFDALFVLPLPLAWVSPIDFSPLPLLLSLQSLYDFIVRTSTFCLFGLSTCGTLFSGACGAQVRLIKLHLVACKLL